MTNLQTDYLQSALKQFRYYKMLGEQAMQQISDDKLFVNEPNSNSIAVIVKHLSGNMISRWTDFLTTDGEKEGRNRDDEFENDLLTRAEIMQTWEAGWKVFLSALESLNESQLADIIFIRNQDHTVMEAINRQLSHYPYHVGQIVFISKMHTPHWRSLSIPRGESSTYNQGKFEQPRLRANFTDEFLATNPSSDT